MLLPSEIQRVDDWVGIETPIRPPVVASSAAGAQPASDATTRPAAAVTPISFLNKSVPFVDDRTSRLCLDLNVPKPFRFFITRDWQRCQISVAGKTCFPMIWLTKSERSHFAHLSIALKIRRK
jgi:hypothetical protein